MFRNKTIKMRNKTFRKKVCKCDFPGVKPRVDYDPRSLKYSNAQGKIK